MRCSLICKSDQFQINSFIACINIDKTFLDLFLDKITKRAWVLCCAFYSSCTQNKAYNSRWGCHSGSKTPLNIIITDQKNQIIYPRSEFIKDSSTLWYAMPGLDESHSNELVFSNLGVPFYLEKHRELRIWCGEDLKNKDDHNNQGRVCVDVFIKCY